jgi:hypothetical protein
MGCSFVDYRYCGQSSECWLLGIRIFQYTSANHNYVQSHKDELKGSKGDDGRDGYDGIDGRNGTNSYSPTHCSTYDYSFGSSTNCY